MAPKLPLRAFLALAGWLAVAGAARQLPQTQPGQTPPPPPTGLITGRVVDGESGLPVAGVVVALSGRAAAAPPSPLLPPAAQASRMLTDAEGRFFFRDLAAGTYSLTSTKSGWIAGAFGRRRPAGPTDVIELTDGERRSNVTVMTWRSAVISGRVLDETSDPLVGVDVRAVQLSYLAGHRQTALVGRSITDDRGAYRFATLIPGDYLIVVPATVTSEPTAFPGVIRAAGEMPHTYYQTMTTAAAAPTSFDRSEIATADDRWAIAASTGLPALPPPAGAWPTYVTTFFPSTTALESASVVRAVSGKDQSAIDVIVKLTTTFQVSGTLMGPDGPAANHAVHLLQASTSESPLFDAATSITDGNGAFRFYGVAPGQYVARVVRVPWPTGGRMAIIGGTGALKSIGVVVGGPASPPPGQSGDPLLYASQTVSVSDSDRAGVQLMLRPGPLVRGHLEFDGATDRPTPEALRPLAILIEPAGGYASTVTAGRVSPDNSFLATSVVPGRYLIRGGSLPNWTFQSATYRGRDVSETPIDLSEDLDDVVVTFTDHPSKIGGTVQNADGAPGQGAVVILFPIDPSAWVDHGRTSRRVRMTSVSASGTFSMQTPPMSGEYAIVAIPEEQSVNWQNPEILRRLLAISDPITVTSNQSATRSLRVRVLR